MLVAVPQRETAGMHGIPGGTGGGDHTSSRPAVGRRGDPDVECRAGPSRREEGGYRAGDGEEGRLGSDMD